MNRFCLLSVVLGIISSSVYGEGDTLRITLEEAINRGVDQSVDAMAVRNEYRSSYWAYRTYQAELLPEVSVNGTIPFYSRSYNAFQKEDGSYTFVGNDYSRIDAGVSVSQNIPWTGGVLSLESGFERLQQYGENSSTRYMSNPGVLMLEQPLFGFKRIRWMQRIEPVKFREAKQKLVAEMENVASLTVTYYFNLLLGQVNLEIAEQNLKNTEKLYHIAEARRKIGQISENDLMQLKISLLKAEASFTNAQSSVKARMFQLRSHLGYNEEVVIIPLLTEILSEDIPQLEYMKVLECAHSNNPFTQNIRRRMLEASRDVSQAKSDRWSVTVFASFGMSGQENTFTDAFSNDNLRSSQKVQVGVRVPILDWGKGKGKVRVAEANREVLSSRIEKEKMDFNQDLFILVENFNNQSRQVDIARETDRVADVRYNTSVEAFILGNIDVLNLNDAQASKDEAKRNYVEQLFYFWSYYYQIRGLTLYDFIECREIAVSEAEILK